MNHQILLGVIHPFILGWQYGKQGNCWTPREANQRIGFRNQDDEDLFLNGMEDGLRGDRFRLDRLKS